MLSQLKEKLRVAAKKVVGANRVASIAVSPIKDRMKAPSLADLQSAKQSMGDITVLAVQRVKDLKLAVKDDSKCKSHSPAGGIAALAAAAALKKHHLFDKNQEGNETSAPVTRSDRLAFLDGGIAAAAAAAATAAAQNRNKASKEEAVKDVDDSTGHTADKSDAVDASIDIGGGPPRFLGGGGIAVAAAAAARNRNKVRKEEATKDGADTREPAGSGPPHFLGGGGIATAAAAAARNRNKVPKEEVDKGGAGKREPVGSGRAPFLGGAGIAAAAAAAARNRNKASNEEVGEDGDGGKELACDASDASVLHLTKSGTTNET